MSAQVTPWAHVVSISGGKDSTALYLLALERMQVKGREFTPVFADTGNEHEWTYDFVRNLARITNGPEPVWVKADFTDHMARKRAFIARRWPRDGVPMDRVEKAISLLHPTGNPFLDLCFLHGRFPSSKARFCTEELKIEPMFSQVQRPILEAGRTLISWQGVRAEESLARRHLPQWQQMNPVPYGAPKALRDIGNSMRAFTYRPLIDWKIQEVFDFHTRHGVPWNPLYDAGMTRVGCMPCIMARKDELRGISQRFPEHIERIAEWEALVSELNKQGISTFFNVSDDPVIAGEITQKDWSLERFGVRQRVEWSKTSRGGKQYDLLLDADENFGTACNSWGACE